MLSRLLQRFSVDQQRYGEFLDTGTWNVCGCGSFRSFVREGHAKGAFYVFAQRLERKLRRNVAVFGVLEHRYSGCGDLSGRRHWHLVVACPGLTPELLRDEVSSLWSARYGNCLFERFVPGRDAAYYTAKTASQENFEWEAHQLDLAYRTAL